MYGNDEEFESFYLCPGCRDYVIHFTKVICDKCSKELDDGLDDLTRGGEE